jgi:hypothetical protein
MVERCGRGWGRCNPFETRKDADYGWGMSREYVSLPFRAPVLRWENGRVCRCRGALHALPLSSGLVLACRHRHTAWSRPPGWPT